MNPDDRLDALLRAGDPAGSLPFLTPSRIHDLTEHAMTNTAPERTDRTPSRSHPIRRGPIRRRMVVGAAGLLGAAAAAAIAFPLAIGTPAAEPPTALRLPEAVDPASSICAPVSAESIGGADLAFRGEVTGVEGGVATLRVLDRYTGDPADTVIVPEGDAAAADGSGPVFANGGTYLVAAFDGTVLACGGTGTDDPALGAIYDEAFGG